MRALQAAETQWEKALDEQRVQLQLQVSQRVAEARALDSRLDAAERAADAKEQQEGAMLKLTLAKELTQVRHQHAREHGVLCSTAYAHMPMRTLMVVRVRVLARRCGRSASGGCIGSSSKRWPRARRWGTGATSRDAPTPSAFRAQRTKRTTQATVLGAQQVEEAKQQSHERMREIGDAKREASVARAERRVRQDEQYIAKAKENRERVLEFRDAARRSKEACLTERKAAVQLERANNDEVSPRPLTLPAHTLTRKVHGATAHSAAAPPCVCVRGRVRVAPRAGGKGEGQDPQGQPAGRRRRLPAALRLRQSHFTQRLTDPSALRAFRAHR